MLHHVLDEKKIMTEKGEGKLTLDSNKDKEKGQKKEYLLQ